MNERKAINWLAILHVAYYLGRLAIPLLAVLHLFIEWAMAVHGACKAVGLTRKRLGMIALLCVTGLIGATLATAAGAGVLRVVALGATAFLASVAFNPAPALGILTELGLRQEEQGGPQEPVAPVVAEAERIAARADADTQAPTGERP